MRGSGGRTRWSVKGCTVALVVKGCTVVVVEGCEVAVEGCAMAVQGCTVVAVEGCTVAIAMAIAVQGCAVEGCTVGKGAQWR